MGKTAYGLGRHAEVEEPEEKSKRGPRRAPQPTRNAVDPDVNIEAKSAAALAKLMHDLEAHARKRVPASATEDIAHDALDDATRRWLCAGGTGSLRKLAMTAATSLCKDWHRRRARRGDLVPLPDNLPSESPRRARAPRVRPTIERLLARRDGALTPKQRLLARLMFEGEGPSTNSLARRMSLSWNNLDATIRSLAKKLRSTGKNLPRGQRLC